jgi:hypothetical protein
MALLLRFLAVIAFASTSSFAFVSLPTRRHVDVSMSSPVLFGAYFDEEDEADRDYARIRRGQRRQFNDDRETEQDIEYQTSTKVINDNAEWDEEDEVDYQGVIPNALLDNIDPEGSSERFGELIRDGKFWRDILLLLLFLNFLDNLRDPAVFDAIDMATLQ